MHMISHIGKNSIIYICNETQEIIIVVVDGCFTIDGWRMDGNVDGAIAYDLQPYEERFGC